MQNKCLVAFSPPIPGVPTIKQPRAWGPKRNVVGRTVSEQVGKYVHVEILKSGHPSYLKGVHYQKCVYMMEEAYEKDGKYYRDSSDAEIVFDAET